MVELNTQLRCAQGAEVVVDSRVISVCLECADEPAAVTVQFQLAAGKLADTACEPLLKR